MPFLVRPTTSTVDVGIGPHRHTSGSTGTTLDKVFGPNTERFLNPAGNKKGVQQNKSIVFFPTVKLQH